MTTDPRPPRTFGRSDSHEATSWQIRMRDMDAGVRTDRSFEHTLDDRDDLGAGAAYYERLLQVSFRHTYYNGSGEACPALGAEPTPSTQALIRSLGLLFRDEGTGFSILYDVSRKADLATYLRRQGRSVDGEPIEFWTRLSFLVWSRSPYFISVTDVPIDINPSTQNFYISNQSSHVVPGGGVILNPGQWVGAGQLLPVIGTQYPVHVTDDISRVVVRAISGETVICEPRCLKPDPPSVPIRGARAAASLAEQRCRDVIYLNFSQLPEDKYTIEFINLYGQVDRREIRLYSMRTPSPLCLVDLLFNNPTGRQHGVYPVRHIENEDRTTFTRVDYVLNFAARSTFWNYYIVPQSQRFDLDDLAIVSIPPGPAARFAGPCRVTLPNGANAYRFVSEQPLVLQQQSDYRFRLLGRQRERSLEQDILVDRLPVPGEQQVTPQTGAMARLRLADSLLPDAESEAGCDGMVRRFFDDPRAGAPDPLDRMRKLRAGSAGRDFARPPMRRGATTSVASYSDIYVYV